MEQEVMRFQWDLLMRTNPAAAAAQLEMQQRMAAAASLAAASQAANLAASQAAAAAQHHTHSHTHTHLHIHPQNQDQPPPGPPPVPPTVPNPFLAPMPVHSAAAGTLDLFGGGLGGLRPPPGFATSMGPGFAGFPMDPAFAAVAAGFPFFGAHPAAALGADPLYYERLVQLQREQLERERMELERHHQRSAEMLR